ncbi:MAG: N-acetyltransferase, partial [Oscillospiraceae bacterium]|nr:N-acetyltransferase [Oscillospiraceae bacterium]
MNKNDYKIRLETPADYKAVENLTREAFWNVYRPGCLEHFVIYKLRDDEHFIKELSFVLEKDGEIIGHIAFMRATITTFNGQNIPIATFGPISISPHYQRCGFGKILLDFALNKAKSMGIGAICMEGNIDFYGKCGFVVASTKKIHYHAEPIENDVPYFLLKELMPRYLDGIEGI